MPIKVNNTASSSCYETELSPKLLEDLERVSAIVRECAGCGCNLEDGQGLALVKIIRGLSEAEWQRIVARFNLSEWLGIPLHGSLAESTEEIIATLENLTFQRDHDVLTGLANRRMFMPRLELEIERAIRSDAELCLMTLDLDYFKNINDTYGHPCGDEVLRRLGKVIKDSVRPYDLAARIGGEEFAVMFPATSCWTGAMLGNRILESFSAEIFECDGETFSVTFSAGITSVALIEGVITSEKLIASADEALYSAKEEGRNRVCVSKSGKRARDRATLVQANEKQFLFSNMGSV